VRKSDVPNDARTLSPETQEALRRRAVDAVEKEGMRVVDVAKSLGVRRQSVQEWLKLYREGGDAALARGRKGPAKGFGQLLEPWQQGVIVRMITDNCPDQLKLPFCLWTREAVAELVYNRFRIKIAIRTVGDYLKNWGFTAQKPARRAFEQDPEAVRNWREADYPAIEREAKKLGAQIHWADETGIRSDHHAGRSYSPKGKTPVVNKSGKRFGANVISSVTNRGELRFMVFKERFTSPVFIEFLSRLVRRAERMIFLIVDGHPVHRSAAVRAWLQQNCEKIRLFFLPPYAPESNPDEYLNNDLKSNAVGRSAFRDLSGLLSGVRSYLRATQKRSDIVQSYFRHPDVAYAAAR
jgi:transposase